MGRPTLPPPRRRHASLVPLVAITLAVAGCAPSRPSRVSSLDERASDTVTPPRTRVLPAPAPTYDVASAPRPHPLDVDAASFESAARDVLGARGADLTADARLDALAAWVDCSPELERGGLPSASAIEAAARRLGLVEPLPTVVCVQAPRRPEAVREQLARVLVAVPSNVPVSHIGVATRGVVGGMIGVVALSAREVRVAPFSRRVDAGGAAPSVTLDGELSARFTASRLSVTTPTGATVAGDGQRRFTFPVATPTPGVYDVEVLGDGPSGPVVVLNVKVYAGVAEPSELTDDAPVAGARVGPLTAASSEARLLELVTAARASAGVTPVKLDAELSRLALAHAQDMSANNFMGHVSPTKGDFTARARAAGIDAVQLGENVGFAASPDAVHRSLMESPAHRANLLDRGMNAVGIGVVVAATDNGEARIYAAEVFARRVPPMDPKTAADAIVSGVNDARASHGVKPLARDAKLDAIVRGALTAAGSAEALEPAVLAEAHKRFVATMRGVRGCLFVNRAREVSQVVAGDWALRGAATRLGVAVAPIAGSPEGLVVIVTTGTKDLACE